jgi:hypothetical protein
MDSDPRHSRRNDPQTIQGAALETEQQLDPRTAYVGFRWGEIVPGDPCIGRIYYWYDPKRRLPAVDDWDFRRQHPEIADREWQQLFYEAFDRGETEFEHEFAAGTNTPLAKAALSLGRMFGPRPPGKAD